MKRWSRQTTRNAVNGYAFISPWLIGLALFTIYPIIASLYYSFTRYDIVRAPRWIGLENYVTLATEDLIFRRVMGNTIYLVVIGVPAGIIVAYLLALLLNNEMTLRPIFRTIFFLPALVPAVAAAEVWRWVLNAQWGLINAWMKTRGWPVIPFLSSEGWAKNTLILIHCWAQGQAMMVFLASLQDVPRALYDAAEVDGASAVQRFWYVTVPMTTPAMLFLVITHLIGMFQYFTMGWLLTSGGPNFSTEFFSIYLYRNAFEYFKMGYASALSWVLFLIIMLFTVVTFRSSERWVYYGGV
jgi:multiple sugar transport system permease protein